MGEALTKKQKRVLDYITEYVQEYGFAPTFREKADELDLSSISSVHQYIKVLSDKGYLNTSHNEARSIELTALSLPTPDAIQLPLVGLIQAGEPIEAVDSKESMAVPTALVDDPANTYILKVRGDSMIDDGIMEGDFVIVERNPSPKNGDIVVALLDNAYATLKRFYREKNRIRLQPANSTMKPIYVSDPLIQGVVKGLVRTFSEKPLLTS